MSDTNATKPKKGFKLTKRWIILIVVAACLTAVIGTALIVDAVSTNPGVKVFEKYISAAKSQNTSKMAGLFYEKGSDEYDDFLEKLKEGKSDYAAFVKKSSDKEIEDYEKLPEVLDDEENLIDYGFMLKWEENLAKNIASVAYKVEEVTKFQIILSITVSYKKVISSYPAKFSAEFKTRGNTDEATPEKYTVTFKKHDSKGTWYFASGFRLVYGPDAVSTYTTPYETAKDGKLELKRANISDNLSSKDGQPVYYTEGTTNYYDITRLSDKIVSIGAGAFSGIKEVHYIIIPEGTINIGAYAFKDCAGLKGVVYPDKTQIKEDDDITIGEGAFYGCKALESFVLPVKNKIIPNYLLAGCEKIRTFTIADTTAAIGYYAFYGTSITSIEIPDSVAVIGDGAFESCIYLVTINTDNVIKNNITRMGANVFKNCFALERITLPSSITEIGKGMFDGCSKLSEITFPSGLKRIGAKAFRKTAIVDIALPSTVEIIGNEAFLESKIVNFSFTNSDKAPSIRTIGEKAFYSCVSLSYMDLPASLKGIGAGAFLNCTDMRVVMVNFPRTTVVGEFIFSSKHGIPKLYLTDNALDYFKVEWYSMGVAMYSQEIITRTTNGNFAITDETRKEANGNIVKEKVLVQYLGGAKDGNVTLSTDIARIGEGAFSYARDLNNIVNFDQLEKLNAIGADVFYESGMNFDVYGNDETGRLYYVGDWVINGENLNDTLDLVDRSKYKLNGNGADLPDTIGVAAKAFFEGTSEKITTIYFNSQLKYIGISSFAGLNLLSAVEFEGNSQLVTIGENAFNNNSALDHIELTSQNLAEIGNGAFDYCSALRYVRIDSDKDLLLGTNVFRLVDDALKIYVKNYDTSTYYASNQNWKQYDSGIFDTGVINGKYAIVGDTLIQYLWTDINTTTDEKRAENYNIELSDTNIKKIGAGAFARSVIQTITIHSGIEEIENFAFYICQSLRKVEFLANAGGTSSLMRIGNNAFRDCELLSEVTGEIVFNATTHNQDFAIGDNPFDSTLYRNVYVENRANYQKFEPWKSNPKALAATDDPRASITVEIEGDPDNDTHQNTVSIDGEFQRMVGETEIVRIVNEDIANGYEFDGWYTGDGESASDSAVLEIKFIEDLPLQTFKAVFKKVNSLVTIVNTIGGEIMNGGVKAEETLLVTIGETLELVANNNYEYDFVAWYINGELQEDATTSTLTISSMPRDGISVSVEYIKVRAWVIITGDVDLNGFEGTVVRESGKTKVLLSADQTVTITADPINLFEFSHWVIDTVEQHESSETVTLTMTDDLIDINIYAKYEAITNTVTVQADENMGDIVIRLDGYAYVPALDEQTYGTQSKIFLKATAKVGYKFVKWTLNGENFSTEAEINFILTEDMLFEAIFELDND